jgi:hypothetical protein
MNLFCYHHSTIDLIENHRISELSKNGGIHIHCVWEIFQDMSLPLMYIGTTYNLEDRFTISLPEVQISKLLANPWEK